MEMERGRERSVLIGLIISLLTATVLLNTVLMLLMGIARAEISLATIRQHVNITTTRPLAKGIPDPLRKELHLSLRLPKLAPDFHRTLLIYPDAPTRKPGSQDFVHKVPSKASEDFIELHRRMLRRIPPDNAPPPPNPGTA